MGKRWEMLPSHGVPVAHSFVLDPAASSLLFASPPLPVSGPQAKVPVRAHLTAWHKSASESCSVVSNSLRPHGLYSPRSSLGQNTGVGSLSLLQRIFPTQGSNPGLLHCRRSTELSGKPIENV